MKQFIPFRTDETPVVSPAVTLAPGAELPPGIDVGSYYAPTKRDTRTPTKRIPLGDRRLAVFIIRLLALLAILLFWQYAPRSVLPPFAFGKPYLVWRIFWYMPTHGYIVRSTYYTLLGVVYGIAIAAPLGIILAGALSIKVVRFFLEPFETAFNAIPKFGLVCPYIFLFGLSQFAHVALVVSFVLFVFLYSAQQAINEIDRNYLSAFRLLGASRLKIFQSLIVPGSIPMLIAATRIALPLAFTVEIYAEMSSPTQKGLGYLLAFGGGPRSIAIMLLIAMIAFVFDALVGGGMRRYAESIGSGMKGRWEHFGQESKQ